MPEDRQIQNPEDRPVTTARIGSRWTSGGFGSLWSSRSSGFSVGDGSDPAPEAGGAQPIPAGRQSCPMRANHEGSSIAVRFPGCLLLCPRAFYCGMVLSLLV